MIAFVVLALSACGKSGADPAMDEQLLAEMDGYADWQQTADWTGVVSSEAVHGPFVQIWWNDVAFAELGSGSGQMPEGSVIVKESYEDAGGAELNNVTAMMKSGGAWYWGQLDADGALSSSGSPRGCVNCHEGGVDFTLAETP